MKIDVKYSELYKQLIGIIIIPIILAAFFISIIYILNTLKVNDTVFTVYNLVGSIIVVLLCIFISRKLLLKNAEVVSDHIGLNFQLEKPSFLYNDTSILILYNNIEEISFEDNDNYRIYVKIKTSSPKKIIYVSPDKYENNDSFISYWHEIKEKIDQGNLK